MGDDLQIEVLAGSWLTLLHMRRSDAACALTRCERPFSRYKPGLAQLIVNF